MPGFLRTLPVLAMTVALLLGGAPVANAHAELESSSPRDDASLSSPPERVVLEFGAPVDPARSTVTVIGPDGSSHWEAGKPTATGTRLTTGLRPLDQAGWYAVTYRAHTTDGHTVAGSVNFELRKTSGASQQQNTGGFGWWPWLVVGAVVLIAAGVLAARLVTRGRQVQ